VIYESLKISVSLLLIKLSFGVSVAQEIKCY